MVIALAATLVGTNLWSQIQSLREKARAAEGVSEVNARVAGGAALGLNTAFLDWVNRRVPSDAHFYFYPGGPGGDPASYQWMTYQLTPRISADHPSEADWLVFVNVNPNETDYDRAGFDEPVRFADKFYLAKRRAS